MSQTTHLPTQFDVGKTTVYCEGRHRTVAGVWTYPDEHGKPLYEVVRLEPGLGKKAKTFLQRLPSAQRWSIGGVRRVLYNLPAVLEAVEAGRTIYVVEGEKCAEAINVHDPDTIGYVATTNPGGAKNWRDEFADSLKGADHVVVWRDKDEDGRGWADNVSNSLKKRDISFEVVMSPHAHDAADHFEAGYDFADIKPDEPDNFRHPVTQQHDSDPDATSTRQFPHTDLGNAERFAAEHGAGVRYVHVWRRWLVWSGRHWQRDETQEVQRLAGETVKRIYEQAWTIPDSGKKKEMADHGLRSQSERGLGAMLRLAMSQPQIASGHEGLDKNEWLLNIQNGTLDLQTCQLLAHRSEDMLTHLLAVNYDPKTSAPAWQEFLERVLPDPELREFVRRAVGYSLTGSTREQCFFLLHGDGANGKSTFLETIRTMLGKLAQAARFETFLVKRSETIPNDIARMCGIRFLTASENQDRRRLDESTIKQLTGGDTVTARFMRGEFFEFTATAKLWLAANHKPAIAGTDLAMWRRVRLIPFTVTIPEKERDPDLPEKLRAEIPGILAWAVEGCRSWVAGGLGTSDTVEACTSSYRNEQDVFSQFLSDECVIDPGVEVEKGALWQRYRAWSAENGDPSPGNRRKFSQQLQRRLPQVKERRTATVRLWVGIGFCDATDGCDADSDKALRERGLRTI